eukprot:CAMPEP_0204270052 /NCGR_PEP_ID=MMETSP0468-20130131/18043_1 /ASSEMBLY_ACC=CAM_ASM_000383 /TAXON_ID=2969 /ORGANISM="Oxyrrhis marina" /LENGTH=256 /DNA_ID=CAMNT_0051245539 /DNA_START=35 /DNA_END=805 /DNA_ORIENTATION=+
MANTGSMRVLLVRHGESENNALHLRPGMTHELWEQLRTEDPVLSDMGQQQADALADYISGATQDGRAQVLLPVGQILVSPVLRALQTAEPTAKALGLQPTVWPEIYEKGGIFHNGKKPGHGMGRVEMQERFPTYQIPDEVTDQGWYGVDEPRGKETMAEAADRARRVAARLREMVKEGAGRDGATLLVAHHDFLDLLCQELILGSVRSIPPNVFVLYNTAVHGLELHEDGSVTTLFLNSVNHLSAEQMRVKMLGCM